MVGSYPWARWAMPTGEDDEDDAATTCVADEDVEDIIEGDPSRYDVNVHTADHPSGAIRGQLHALS